MVFDTTKPDGTPRKLLDVGRLTSLGWKPAIGLEDGIRQTYLWYQQHALAVPAEPRPEEISINRRS